MGRNLYHTSWEMTKSQLSRRMECTVGAPLGTGLSCCPRAAEKCSFSIHATTQPSISSLCMSFGFCFLVPPLYLKSCLFELSWFLLVSAEHLIGFSFLPTYDSHLNFQGERISVVLLIPTVFVGRGFSIGQLRDGLL